MISTYDNFSLYCKSLCMACPLPTTPGGKWTSYGTSSHACMPVAQTCIPYATLHKLLPVMHSVQQEDVSACGTHKKFPKIFNVTKDNDCVCHLSGLGQC